MPYFVRIYFTQPADFWLSLNLLVGGFFSGLGIYLGSLRDLLKQAPLRAWYFRAVLKTFIGVVFFVGLIWVGGVYGLWTALGGGWISGVATVVWVVAMFYVSGILTLSLLNLLIPWVLGEKSLYRAINGRPDFKALKSGKGLRKQELKRVLISISVSLFGWPLLLFPPTVPVAILVFAWAIGFETLATGERMASQMGEGTVTERGLFFAGSHALGMGIIPALASVVPILGWAFLPVLPYAGIMNSRRLSRIVN